MNLLLTGFVCPNCYNIYNYNGDGVLSNYFTMDYDKSEVICNVCGMVVKDDNITTLADKEYIISKEMEYSKLLESDSIPYIKKIPSKKYDVASMLDNMLLGFEEKKRKKAEERKRKQQQKKSKR